MEAIQLSFIPGFVVFAIGGICYILMMRFVDNVLKSDPIKENADIEAQTGVETPTQTE